MKNATDMTAKELVASILGTDAKHYKSNGKVYAGFIYVNDEKVAVSEDFAELFAKGREIQDTDEYMDVLFEGEESDRVAFLLQRL